MSCCLWRDLQLVASVDELAEAQREEFLLHLQGCSSCRRAATEADPTVIFSLLPAERIDEREVEEIRRTVQAMRRVRALEASWSRRGLAAGAFAAMVLLAIVLIPERPLQQSHEEVPFAGAVGVGSGLVNVPRLPSDGSVVELQVELARSARVPDLSDSSTLQRISRLEVIASPGEWVDRDLGQGYRIRFSLAREARLGSPILQDFQLLHPDLQGEVSLFNADLKPVPDAPLILSLTPVAEEEEQLWLLVTYSAEEPVTLVSKN